MALSTKEKIFYTAAKLFSDRGDGHVSMRDIAKAVGIKVASIYNHFASKEDLLKAFYVFYRMHRQLAELDMPALLRMAETDPPHEILARIRFHYDPHNPHDPPIEETLNHIVIIAARKLRSDPASEIFLKENFLDLPAKLYTPLLERMIALGRIEPINIQALVSLVSHHCFSAAILIRTPWQTSPETWKACRLLLLSLIKPTGK
ncbi:hypothetical protein FACS1894211_11510 [Clostridia bacterium]|nr:hypothetical protein FACS1894211_11510 [Clostridia bacterium]